MNQVIRDRRPTEADADKSGEVETWNADRWIRCRWDSSYVQKLGNPWRPIDQTPPPEPEKPKRREWWIETLRGTPQVLDIFHEEPTDKGGKVRAIEVLPGDPPDLDELLKEIDTGVDFWTTDITACRGWIKRILNARHGEGGRNA